MIDRCHQTEKYTIVFIENIIFQFESYYYWVYWLNERNTFLKQDKRKSYYVLYIICGWGCNQYYEVNNQQKNRMYIFIGHHGLALNNDSWIFELNN